MQNETFSANNLLLKKLLLRLYANLKQTRKRRQAYGGVIKGGKQHGNDKKTDPEAFTSFSQGKGEGSWSIHIVFSGRRRGTLNGLGAHAWDILSQASFYQGKKRRSFLGTFTSFSQGKKKYSYTSDQSVGKLRLQLLRSTVNFEKMIPWYQKWVWSFWEKFGLITLPSVWELLYCMYVFFKNINK